MTGDAEPRKSGARRPGRTILLAVAVLLLIGGGTAVAVGVAGQDADPPAPSATRTTGSSTQSASAEVPRPEANNPDNRPTAGPREATAAESIAPAALPVSVTIPAIGVTSELITLGLNPDGTLAVPEPGPDYDKAGWFDGSPRPGEVGPAVVEGHVDSAANGPSVFYGLGALVVGDRVDVTREDGSVVTFEVYEVRVVPKDDFPTFDVYGNTDGPELRLITCGGPFDSAARSYEDNVVVFASLAP